MNTGRDSPPDEVAVSSDRIRPETRQRHLEIAAKLALTDTSHEPAFAHIVSHITLADVAKHLGTSRSSLYRLWDTQHDFWTDLAFYVTSRTEPWPEDFGPDDPSTVLTPGHLDGLAEFIRQQFGSIQQQAIDDPYLVARASLVGYPAIPDLSTHLSAWHRIRRQGMAERLAAILNAAGRAPSPPSPTRIWPPWSGCSWWGRLCSVGSIPRFPACASLSPLPPAKPSRGRYWPTQSQPS